MIVLPALERLLKGTRWTWVAERHRPSLPADFDQGVMEWRSADRYHAKQGRSTARFRFDGPGGPLAVYLKRFDRLPLGMRLAAALVPKGRFSPGVVEWAHLERARSLGIPVPEVVAVGERIGPWARLSSFLMVRELAGCEALNEALPGLGRSLPPEAFARFKRSVIAEMAALTARLHASGMYHKDLYLCHFFLDASPDAVPGSRLTLIDLHRLGRHRWLSWRWRAKDLGQLLFSTAGVAGIDDRDRLRFWSAYRRAARVRAPRWQAGLIRAKAARYRAHNS